MSRQTTDIDLRKGVRYQCDHCDRAEHRQHVPAGHGGDDASARTVGYRISSGAPDATVICPECSGVDEDYWDTRTLESAYMAGIDAGNTAWGGA